MGAEHLGKRHGDAYARIASRTIRDDDLIQVFAFPSGLLHMSDQRRKQRLALTLPGFFCASADEPSILIQTDDQIFVRSIHA